MSRIDILVLSCLARLPMHGYEIKLELQYRHVRWWAKCEHGHLYAALKRLEKAGHVKGSTRREGKRARRVYAITAAGRRYLRKSLRNLVEAEDSTYFDIDLFLAAAYTMKQEQASTLLRRWADLLEAQKKTAEALYEQMSKVVPAVGLLIMRHRVEHLAREAAFAAEAAAVLAAEPDWGPFLGKESIRNFLVRTSARLELDR